MCLPKARGQIPLPEVNQDFEKGNVKAAAGIAGGGCILPLLAPLPPTLG